MNTGGLSGSERFMWCTSDNDISQNGCAVHTALTCFKQWTVLTEVKFGNNVAVLHWIAKDTRPALLVISV